MIEYTPDYVGQKVREMGQILSTLSNEEIVAWIGDIVMDACQDDKSAAIAILDLVMEEIDYR